MTITAVAMMLKRMEAVIIVLMTVDDHELSDVDNVDDDHEEEEE